MSDTDKTRPEWVQMLDPYNKGWLEEHHDHTDGICNIEEDDVRAPSYGRRKHCSRWPSRIAGHEGIYPRPSRRVRYYSYGYVRAVRTHWREMRNKILCGDVDAADGSPSNFNNRHRALWDAW